MRTHQLARVPGYVLVICDRRVFVLKVASMRMDISVVVPCNLVEVNRRFRGACCLRYQNDRFN
jgi:hypothetical protein